MMLEKRLNYIFNKTDERCHICGKTLYFYNYGKHGTRGAWHIEHSHPKSLGGTDHLNNLFPACISCNLEKGNGSTRTIRRKYGLRRAPYSEEELKTERINNAVALGIVGTAIGTILSPRICWLFGIVGACVGYDMECEDIELR